MWGLEPTTFGFPDLPERKVDALLIWPPQLVVAVVEIKGAISLLPSWALLPMFSDIHSSSLCNASAKETDSSGLEINNDPMEIIVWSIPLCNFLFKGCIVQWKCNFFEAKELIYNWSYIFNSDIGVVIKPFIVERKEYWVNLKEHLLKPIVTCISMCTPKLSTHIYISKFTLKNQN